MLQNILNLKGIEKLNKDSQKKINGGVINTNCDAVPSCPFGGYRTPTFRKGLMLVCCAGSPDN
ncbi:hypothetical protein [Aquimarina litoralis]|uniref:hypothetical protein n=1 Tax=Aquimarina litoralis TaxID=584605 RepID=UPI001C5993F7|nr:hypothetical protein [Aquimarina litoralis]MBW1298858.1 hypothetical protein [Aquimarina litoralis]